MTDDIHPPVKRFARAEASARRLVIVVGAGFMAAMVGGLISTGLSVRLAERVGTVRDPAAAFVTGWALQRVWLWLVLPAIGWVVGRFVAKISPIDFALTSAISGELFGMLLSGAVNGFDFVFPSVGDALVRVLTFALGAWLVFRSVREGLVAFEDRQRAAQALAQRHRAEYAATVSPAVTPSLQGDQHSDTSR